MADLTGFCIMQVADVDAMKDEGEWDECYTTDSTQLSDDGDYIWVAGVRVGAVMTFTTTKEMFEYCYSNGWTKMEDID